MTKKGLEKPRSRRCARQYGLACVLVTCFAALQAARAQEEQDGAGFAPLALDLQTSLDVDYEPGLDLGSAGTIEFWVVALWEDAAAVSPFPAVLGMRDVYEEADPAGLAEVTRYSIHLSADRKTIGLFDGTRFASVPFDFSDGELHHVAFATEGALTRVYVDGASLGELGVGYGRGTELPLHIGSSDGASELFGGIVASVRLWRGALTSDELEEVRFTMGPPAPEHRAAAKIAAYSEFTEHAKAIVVVGSDASSELASRGIADKVRKARKKAKVEKLAADIEETEDSLRMRRHEAQQLQAKIASYDDAIRNRLQDNWVGEKRMTLNQANRARFRLLLRRGKVQREIQDYTAKLDGGPVSYFGGRVTRNRVGLRQQQRDAQAEAGPAPAGPPLNLPPPPGAPGRPSSSD